MLANILDAFTSLFKSGCESSFFKQVNAESVGLAEKNRDLPVETGQIWRAPLDHADRYMEPVFLSITKVVDSVVYYTTNYSYGKERSLSVGELKEGWVFVQQE